MKALNLLLSSKGIPTKDKVANLLGTKLGGGSEWPITTLTGSLPLVYESRVEHVLKNYALYGSENGAGVETENLFTEFVIEGKQLSPSTDALETNSNYHISDYIPIEAATSYALKIKNSINVSTVRVAFYDSEKTYLETGVNYISEWTSDTLELTFTASSNTAYIRISMRVQCYNVMLVKGSTAPTTYIPFGYKIPLTNTGENSQSSTYPLYIGSTKLGEEEYLDYESGKVYKRTEQLIPRFMPQKKETGHLSIECSADEITVTVLAGASADETLYLDVTPFDIPISVGDGGTGVFVAFVQSVGNTGTYITLRNGATNLIDYGYLIQNTNLVKDSYTFRTQTKTCNRIYFQLSASATPASQTLSIKLCLTDDGQTPAQYIPYYQPTDPPVPFPPIAAYKGENTLSSTETVGEVEITGRIKPIET